MAPTLTAYYPAGYLKSLYSHITTLQQLQIITEFPTILGANNYKDNMGNPAWTAFVDKAQRADIQLQENIIDYAISNVSGTVHYFCAMLRSEYDHLHTILKKADFTFTEAFEDSADSLVIITNMRLVNRYTLLAFAFEYLSIYKDYLAPEKRDFLMPCDHVIVICAPVFIAILDAETVLQLASVLVPPQEKRIKDMVKTDLKGAAILLLWFMVTSKYIHDKCMKWLNQHKNIDNQISDHFDKLIEEVHAFLNDIARPLSVRITVTIKAKYEELIRLLRHSYFAKEHFLVTSAEVFCECGCEWSRYNYEILQKKAIETQNSAAKKPSTSKEHIDLIVAESARAQAPPGVTNTQLYVVPRAQPVVMPRQPPLKTPRNLVKTNAQERPTTSSCQPLDTGAQQMCIKKKEVIALTPPSVWSKIMMHMKDKKILEENVMSYITKSDEEEQKHMVFSYMETKGLFDDFFKCYVHYNPNILTLLHTL